MADDVIRGYCSTRGDIVPAPLGRLRGAALAGKAWDRGMVLQVLFLDGPEAYRRRVRTHARTWEAYADITFAFDDDPSAPIRLTFTAAPGRFYSMVGNEALLGGFPPDKHTMNLGFPPSWPLGNDEVEREVRRLILHEFGHALGLIHEHSSPEAGSFFKDPELVYDYYRRTQGWDRQTVDENVLMVYDRGQISNATAFDPDSIMLYEFPAEITTRPTKTNYELSALDKIIIGQLYPRPGGPKPGGNGSLSTGAAQSSVGRLLDLGVPLHVVHGLPGSQDIYHFEVEDHAAYLMETTGDDAWLMTLFRNGDSVEVLTTDQGSGDGLNARIARDLDPGTYHLAVDHVLPDGTGAYDIVVRRAGS
jgi:hypothetical protein